MDWINLAYDRDRCRALVNVVKSLTFIKCREFDYWRNSQLFKKYSAPCMYLYWFESWNNNSVWVDPVGSAVLCNAVVQIQPQAVRHQTKSLSMDNSRPTCTFLQSLWVADTQHSADALINWWHLNFWNWLPWFAASIYRSQKTLKKTRIKLNNTLALPVLLYGSETWTIKASDTRRITAAEMKYMRRTAGYTWTDYKTNAQLQLQTVLILFANDTCIIVKSPN